MIDIIAYQGLAQFGKAYETMLEKDTHTPSSVDRALAENMIRLCPETVGYLYGKYTPKRSYYKKGTLPVLEQYVEKAVINYHSVEERIKAIVRFTASLQDKASDALDSMVFGGTEEEIIARGSDWCTDVARVGCVLNQVNGLSSRIVALFDTEKAYSGHMITEVYRTGVWGATDPLTNVIYYHPDAKPASAWDLMADPGLVKRHYRDDTTPYTTAGQFRGVAIVNYFVWRWKEYDYTISRVNDYQRSILVMAEQGWPGGLRWLHEEDN